MFHSFSPAVFNHWKTVLYEWFEVLADVSQLHMQHRTVTSQNWTYKSRTHPIYKTLQCVKNVNAVIWGFGQQKLTRNK